MVVKGKTFQKSPIQEYGKRATFASLVHQATNTFATLYLVFIHHSFLLYHSPKSCVLSTHYSFIFLDQSHAYQANSRILLFSFFKIAHSYPQTSTIRDSLIWI